MRMYNDFYGTCPLVVHCPWESGAFWKDLIRSLSKEKVAKKIGDVDNLTVFTWNTRPKKGLFERSMERLGMPCTTLGKGCTDWTFLKKTEFLLEALEEVETEYVMAVDCYDVIALGDLNQVVDRFQGMGLEMCFNAAQVQDHYNGMRSSITVERHCWRDYGRLRHINSGIMIARTEFAKLFYQVVQGLVPITRLICENYSNEAKKVRWDQTQVKPAAQLFFPKVGIDHRCEMFQIPYTWNCLRVEPD